MSKPITIQGSRPCLRPTSPLAFRSTYRPTGACLRPNKTLSGSRTLCERPNACCGVNTRTAIPRPYSNLWKSLRKGISGAGKWAASHCFVPRTC